MEPKKTRNVPSNFEKKSKAEDIAFHGLKLCYKVLIIKTVKYLHKKQTHETVDQNRELMFISTHIVMGTWAASKYWLL